MSLKNSGLLPKSGLRENPDARGLKYRDSKKDFPENPGLGPGPGLKIRKYGIRDRDRYSKFQNQGSRIGTGTHIYETQNSETQQLSRRQKKIETRSLGLKMF